MRPAGPALDAVERKTLASLADLAASRRGFKRRRVRGWVPGPVMRDLVGVINAGWRLPRLRSLGLVTSEPAQDAGRPRNPIVLWRITQLGEDEVARLMDRPARRIPKPREDPEDKHQIYVPRGAWDFLTVLQRHDGFVPWETARSESNQRYRSNFWYDDLTLLLNRGFAARENRGTRQKPETWVAATASGRQVRASDLKASKSLVQLHVPGGDVVPPG